MLEEDPDTEIGNYFRTNLLAVRGSIDHADFRKFSSLENGGERVAFILSYPETYRLPLEAASVGKKDPDKMLKLKETGNKFFGRGDYSKALELYSNAALYAPKGDLGVILANRSAALHHLEKHDFALTDIEEAISHNYPKDMMYKLEERRARCLLALKRHAKAVEAFKRTLKALDDAKIPLDRKQKIESDARMMLAVMEKSRQLSGGADFKDPLEACPESENKLPRIKEHNPLYPPCSIAIEIKDAGDAIGRHGIATRKIEPGEVLITERPFCASLLAEYRLTHCHFCVSRIIAPIPATCYKCSSIAYCSIKCRDKDAGTHKVECDLLGALWSSNASVTCLLALKAIVKHPFQKLWQLRDKLRSKEPEEVSRDRPYIGTNYEFFHNLVTHEDERTSEDLFHRAYIAAWLLRLLKTKSVYFPEDERTPDAPGQQLSASELFVADLLQHNLQLLQFNSHEISELVRPKDKSLEGAKSIFIGGGVYPTTALLNHSCNPGVVRYFTGTTMVVRAVKTIYPGNEVCENYGPIFTTTPESERKRKLRLQYWFDCNCEACANHWPILDELDPRILR
ncbi:SET and MYND domain-containing protein 4 isoform X2 [Orussus abietinus]|nr:SET and MYND domain-containing protein 4 isoform X2 [Orussus abietinus]